MEPLVQQTNGHIKELTPEEARALFDQEARQHFGMSGQAFIVAWEAGQFDHDPDQPDLINLIMMLPTVKALFE
ncbi:MAG: hypothetical protein ETSY1_21915 [Candidatus Entotheonella factor]|uniref:Uncharacterized protein n=1 Tax=Entotheonella factor TaxID=1429438 RepID=W4LIS9_ENTF1|nr:MAG: hypothetical protein ETSY1_21915 [Candidatus Entotheonella factor]